MPSQPQVLKAFLESRLVRVPQPDEVRDYFLLHLDMIESVKTMCEAAIEEFSEDNDELSLQVYHDPEIDDDHPTLYVRQYEYDENILDRIDQVSRRFDEDAAEWSGWFHMTTDFQPPKE